MIDETYLVGFWRVPLTPPGASALGKQVEAYPSHWLELDGPFLVMRSRQAATD